MLMYNNKTARLVEMVDTVDLKSIHYRFKSGNEYIMTLTLKHIYKFVTR